MIRKTEHFNENAKIQVNFGYYLYLPKDYNKDDTKKWPLIIYLHGAGERGNGEDELNKVELHGIPEYLKKKDEFPFVVLAPQCPENSFWVAQINNLKILADKIIMDYNIDEDRVYLTGMSMGGYGSWFFAMAYPDKFAALAPVCGGGMAWNAEVLKNIPIWAFHGEKDDVVSIIESERMVNALKSSGADVKFTRYKDLYHDCWTETYKNEELYKWFLQHKRDSSNSNLNE